MDFNVKDIIFEGLAYTVMGILIVFAMLIIIMLVIKMMALFSEEKEETQVNTGIEIKNEEPVFDGATEKRADDTELIAVITAAIAAAMGKSASGLIVRSYKKVSGNAWNKEGRREVLENRF